MVKLSQSLVLKVALLILLVETVTLSFTGFLYVNTFYVEVDEAIVERLTLPAKLMNEGLLAFDTVNNREQMQNIVGEELANAHIIASNNVVFYSSAAELLGLNIESLSTIDAGALSSIRTDPLIFVQDNNVIGISPLFGSDGQTIRFYLYVEVGNSEALARKNAILRLFLLGTLSALVLTSLAIIGTFSLIVFRPLQEMLKVLASIEHGNLAERFNQVSNDEIGLVKRGINSMAARLEEIFNTLEERVRNRTRDLTTSAIVSREVATILNKDELLETLVDLSLGSFALYQVNIYFLDTNTKQLSLAAASGDAGRKLLEQGHALGLDNKGLVPQAARTEAAVVVNDVSLSETHISNPLLPLTKSELAVPIRFGEEILGVLDLQASKTDHFTENYIELFTAFANQIAVSLRNAALFNEVQTARELAVNADKAKSAFLASMSHELRTPLNAIINFSKFLRKGISGPVNDEQEQLIGHIADSGQHLLNLINDILDMSKIEAGSLKLWIENDIDMKDLIEAAINYVQPGLANKSLALYQEIGTLPLMRGDRKRLLQILLNILSNASKFTEQGSIHIQAQRDGAYILISIKDTGVGIAPDDHAKVFQAFAQSDTGIRQGSSGTGLGMPISKNLVEAHGGEIWFESELSKGSCFYIKLPVDQTFEEIGEIPQVDHV